MARCKLTPVPEGASVLTVEQAAERVQLHPETIRRAMTKRDIAFVKIGGRVRIRPEALDAWLTRKTVTTRRNGAQA